MDGADGQLVCGRIALKDLEGAVIRAYDTENDIDRGQAGFRV